MAAWSGYAPGGRRSGSRSPDRRGGGGQRFPDYGLGGHDRTREWDRPGGGGDVWGRDARDSYDTDRERAEWELRRSNGLPMRGRSRSPAYGDGMQRGFLYFIFY